MEFKVLFLLVNAYVLAQSATINNNNCPLNNTSVKNFQKYIQIDTSQSQNLNEAVEFLRSLASEVGLDFAVYEPAGLPICVLTWPGTDTALPSIMLNSHMDVVYADEAEWKYPPFAAHIDEECNMYGRGTQDTKDLGIQYIEAIRRLKEQNVQPRRTVHVTYMPDEETGGKQGMQAFLKTDEFKDLNVGFALDEGLSSETDDLYVTYQDRRAWSINITLEGTGGHGSIMKSNVAVEKLHRLLDEMLEYRRSLAEDVRSVDPLYYGPYTTMNVNMVNGGFAPNVIPTTFSVVADLRLGTNADAQEMLSMVNSWAAQAGNGSKVEYLRREMESLATPTNSSNIFWTAMEETVNDLGFTLVPLVCPATSDMLFVRNYGIPALGFAPKYRTTPKLHQSNEYLNINTFLRGIDIYVAIIKKIADLK